VSRPARRTATSWSRRMVRSRVKDARACRKVYPSSVFVLVASSSGERRSASSIYGFTNSLMTLMPLKKDLLGTRGLSGLFLLV